jgi:O-antigen/teichoic acid export membrane protein
LQNIFKKSAFVINVFKVFTGTSVAQLIGMILTPVLYRLYEPESFGVFALFTATSSVLGTFSTFQYLQLVLLEKNKESAINALWLCRVINIVFSFVILLAIIFFSSVIDNFITNEILLKWLWLLPLIIFLTGQNEIFSIWANRCKEFNVIVENVIIVAVVTPLVSISLAYVFSNETGLFLGLILGQISSLLVLSFKLKGKYNLSPKNINLQTIKNLAIKNKKFPIYLMPTEIINRFNNNLPVFLISNFFDTITVGFYSLSIKMLEIPLRFIGSAIGGVFKQRASEDYHNLGNCNSIFLKTSLTLLFISAFPVLIIGIFAPEIFEFIFGNKWVKAGLYSQLLIPMVFLKLIVSSVSYVFYIYEKFKEDFIIHIYMLISSWFILNFFYSKGDFETGILYFSINYSTIYIYTWIRSYFFTLTKI